MRALLRRWGGVGACCAAILAVVVACADEPPADTSDGLDAAPAEILGEQFAFCHDADAADPATQQYCPLLDQVPEDVCPGLREACAAPVEPKPETGCNDSGSESSGADVQPPPDQGYDPPTMVAGEAVVQVIRWTVALLVALALVAVVLVVVRTLMQLVGRDRAVPALEEPASTTLLDLPAADAVPEAPSGDLLDAAHRALEAGRTSDAVLFARGAALRALGDQGQLRLHRSRTDREYVRSLRRDKERQGRLRLIVRAVEAVRWGGRPVAAEAAKQAVDAASGIVAVVLVLLGTLVTGEARAVEQHELLGRAGLVEVYEAWGFEASWRLRTVRTVDETVNVLVVDADRLALEDEDVVALRHWVGRGGVLLLAGDAPGFPELGVRERVDADAAVAVSRRARDAGLGAPLWVGGPSAVWREARGQPLVLGRDPTGASEAGTVVQLVPLGLGVVLGVSDGRLLDNGSLIAPGNVSFLGGLPWVGSALADVPLVEDATLEIADVAGAPGAQNPVASLSNARLLPLVVQVLVLLAIAALWRGWPFAPLRDPPSEGRLAFAEHARALGHRFFRAGATRHVASAHADLWLRRLGPVALQAAAERHGLDAADARALVDRLQRLADDPDGPDQAVDIKIVEELWRITRSP